MTTGDQHSHPVKVTPPAGGFTSAVILATGDELLSGRRVDTNSAWISAQLEAVGVPVAEHRLLGDDLAALVHALRDLAQPGTLLVGTGGLGPTRDDLARRAIAQAMGDEIVIDAASEAHIRSWFTSRGRTMPHANMVQCERPSRAVMLPNHRGTAPGLLATLNDATIAWFPGPPQELRPMFQHSVLTPLQACASPPAVVMVVSVGLGESNVADRLGDLMDRGRNPTIGTTASHGVVRIHICSKTGDDAAVDASVREVLALIGPSVLAFGRPDEIDADGLPGLVVARLHQHGLTVATGESCTGGMISAALTEVAGSSAVFHGGVVSYANHIKAGVLGVSESALHSHGAISGPVVSAMANGARSLIGADIGIAVSGVAGPGGGSDDKPVGTVWIASAGPGPGVLRATRHRFLGSRDQIRMWATNTALAEILLAAEGRSLTWHTAWPCD